jgi:electron transfer flavoprotein beta subunit
MNIVVTLKQTFDTEAKIVLKDEKIDPTGVETVINPYDEFAVEEALKLKEQFGGTITIVSVGKDESEKSVRTALAMGADSAVMVDPGAEDVDEWVSAEILAKALGEIPYDILLAGRIAVDDGSAQVAVRLAEAINIPSVTSILELNVEDEKATAVREIDGGKETIEVALPAMFTAQKGLNEPRYPSMMGIMKAKKKEVKKYALSDIGIDAVALTPKMKALTYSLPQPRTAGTIIQEEPAVAAAKLATLLREEAKVI